MKGIYDFRPNPGRREKIKLNFYFHTSLRCPKRFYEGLKLHSHRGDELHRPPSSPVINLVGTIAGSSPNLYRRR